MDKNEEDKRSSCKYGSKCYQTNEVHRKKYKHQQETAHKTEEEPAKKRKLNENKTETTRNQVGLDSVIVGDSLDKTDCDLKNYIKTNFLLDFPQDFYDFWEYCKILKPNNPTHAFDQMNLQLVGVYDVLAGNLSESTKFSPEEYLRHWRYFYDPPELQTVLRGDDSTGLHIGYFYDTPDEPPAFLVKNYGLKDGILYKMGDNIFAAVYNYLEETKKSLDPFKKLTCNKLQLGLKKKAEELKLGIEDQSGKIREREKKVIAKTWNKLGLVVPYNKKTELGYRDLVLGDSELRKLLDKLAKAEPEQKTKYLSELQPVLTYASIALDECDFGTGIKLGWNLLAHGIEMLNGTISRYLINSNQLLNRHAFAKIAKAHLADRRKTTNLSILS